LAQPYSAGSGQTENRRVGTETYASAARARSAANAEIAAIIEIIALT
jgi:hypothetical protein